MEQNGLKIKINDINLCALKVYFFFKKKKKSVENLNVYYSIILDKLRGPNTFLVVTCENSYFCIFFQSLA